MKANLVIALGVLYAALAAVYLRIDQPVVAVAFGLLCAATFWYANRVLAR